MLANKREDRFVAADRNMRHRYVVVAFSVICVAAVLLYRQRNVHRGTSPAVAPYTAHLTITKNGVLPDGSSWTTVSTLVLARDGRGRIFEKTEHVFGNRDQKTEWFSFFVQDPANLQQLTWDSKNQVAVLGRWPYWTGRKGCWADEHGQHQSSFPEDWYKVPASPADGKLETIAAIADSSGNKRIKTQILTENLGQKEIQGLTVFGTRMTMTPLESGGSSDMPETTTEIWRSREFDLNLLHVTTGPKYVKRVELSDLQRGDPDPALFEPPQGYTVETIKYHEVTCGQK